MKRFSIGSKYEYCPNGNYWQDVSGWNSSRIYLFCDCKKCGGKVYELRPFEITKKVKKETIEEFRRLNKLDEIKSKINLKNLDAVEELLTN